MSLSDISWSNFGPYSHPSHGDPLSPHSVPQSYYSDAAPLALQLSQFTTLLSRGNLNPAIMELSPEEMERFQKLSNEYEPDIQVRSSVLSIGPRTHRPWDNRDLLSRRNSKARISPSNMLTLILPLLRKPEYVVGHVTLFFSVPLRYLTSTDPCHHTSLLPDYERGRQLWLERYGSDVYTTHMIRSIDLQSLAVAFGYFENLFTLRDTVRVEQELLRIKSLSRLLDQVGQSEHLYEIFVDATESLLTNLISEIHKGIQSNSFDESFLLEAFNNEYESSAIITHFRVSRIL